MDRNMSIHSLMASIASRQLEAQMKGNAELVRLGLPNTHAIMTFMEAVNFLTVVIDRKEMFDDIPLNTEWMSDFKYFLEDLWYHIYIYSNETPLREMGISEACEELILKILDDDEIEKLSVFDLESEAGIYFDQLPEKYKREVAEAAQKNRLFNPYTEINKSISSFQDICTPFLNGTKD